MLSVVFLGVVACLAVTEARQTWGFGYDLPACPEESKAPLGECFQKAHAMVYPCLQELFSNPAWQKCRKVIAMEEEEKVYPSASNNWMGASRNWHTMFMECMGVKVTKTRSKRDTTYGYDRTCFNGVKKAMADCESMAMKDCEQYKVCMEREDIAAARAETNALQEIKSMKTSLCMADYDKYTADLGYDMILENKIE